MGQQLYRLDLRKACMELSYHKLHPENSKRRDEGGRLQKQGLKPTTKKGEPLQ
jgi:hypothetical protein